MNLRTLAFLACSLFTAGRVSKAQQPVPGSAKRLVILKIDGLNADLLYRTMARVDPATGKSYLPWFQNIFFENGTVFENFYTRGISLSAPSWSILDTGRQAIIRSNVEYDRFTGRTYDYLNFFPFYLGYARNREVDMPGVAELDRAGIPLVIAAFGFAHCYQSFQLFQRGVRWMTLEQALKRRLSGKAIWLSLEDGAAPPLSAVLLEEEESELRADLSNPEIMYLDYYTGEMDHNGHQTNQEAALIATLQSIDAVAGRIWRAIQKSQMANGTVFAVVSDHGMNNVPGVFSQTFSLPDLFNSPAGGAHHVVTNREQMSDYKLRGLNPLVHRVITPSTASFYLKGQAEHYPTAWLDMDGNERATVSLRNSDLNEIQILLQQLQRADLNISLRQATAETLRFVIDRNRAEWRQTADQIEQEMQALQTTIVKRKEELKLLPQSWTRDEYSTGEDKTVRRLEEELQEWEREEDRYSAYATHLRALLALQLSADKPLETAIPKLVPEMALGDNNTLRQLQHYIAGLSDEGLVLGPNGRLDEERTFRHIDYLRLLAEQQVRNNPQPALSSHPIDFTAVPLSGNTYLLFGSDENELIIVTDDSGRIMVKPVKDVTQDEDGNVTWTDQPWKAGLPLHLFEDPELEIPASGEQRADWLSRWHSEADWMRAIHKTYYSNGVIGVIEELSPVAANVPGRPGLSPILLRLERRRRQLVQGDFQVFAADHWNFNVRFPNAGGNHGGFFRISTHSVWMLAGADVPVKQISEPYDSLNFANTLLSLAGRTPPVPDKVVQLQINERSSP